MFSRLGLDKKLFNEFNKQLKKLNLIVGKGTIVDATIKQAQATSNSNRDNDADFTKKRGKTYYGYKGHIAIDEESEIIKSVEFTKASIHDSSMFDKLIDYKEKSVFADKGYANKARSIKLESKGIFDGILTKTDKNLNKLFSQIRNRVERPFAYTKRVLLYDRCSYYDLKTNRFEFIMNAYVYNIRKLITVST
jgi:IS5 family transposase